MKRSDMNPPGVCVRISQELAAVGMLAIVVLQGSGPAQAQQYPAKPIRFIAGYAPGGSTDTIGRLVAQGLSESIGQTVVVENRVGAAGTIATDMVAKSAPDGYTVLVGDIGGNAIAPGMYAKLPYDAYRDFEHVTLMVTFPLAVVVPAASRFASLQQLIDEARAKSATLTYGSQGIGSPAHLFAELMNMMAAVKTVHVPYKGGAPAMAALLGHEIDFAVTAVSTAQANVVAGKLRALGVTSAAPTARLPGVPPIASLLPGFDAVNFHSLQLPVRTPRVIVDRLQRATADVLHRPDVTKRLDDLAMDVKASSSDECASFIRSEIEKWGKVVKATGARAE